MLHDLGGRLQPWGRSATEDPFLTWGTPQTARPLVRSPWKLAHPDQLRINQTGREKL